MPRVSSRASRTGPHAGLCAASRLRLPSAAVADLDSTPAALSYPARFEGGAPGGARARRIIVVGGGRGGVGKTLLAVNLGVYFAQLGRDVVVCDADPFGSNLHAVLGLDSPPLALDRRRWSEGTRRARRAPPCPACASCRPRTTR